MTKTPASPPGEEPLAKHRRGRHHTMHYLLLCAVWNLKVLLCHNLTREHGHWVLAR